MDDYYQGPERRSSYSVVGLVEQAAEVAAQNVAAIHRRRLVKWTFLAALLVSLLVVMPTVYLVDRSSTNAAVDRARFNCEQWNTSASVLTDFVRSDVKRQKANVALLKKYPEVITAYNKLFGSKLVGRLIKEQQAYDQRQARYMTERLIPRIRRLADINCKATLTKEGVQQPALTVRTPPSLTITVKR